jgi:hypothetical protein
VNAWDTATDIVTIQGAEAHFHTEPIGRGEFLLDHSPEDELAHNTESHLPPYAVAKWIMRVGPYDD